MPSATRTETFPVDIEAFYQVIIDYESYPEFVDTVTRVKILKADEAAVRAKFFIHLVRDISYVLELHHEPPTRVWWNLVRGDIFSRMDGVWDLRRRGKHRTEVTYSLDVQTKFIAPPFIVSKLVSFNLPSMMRAFNDRAGDLKGV